MQGCRNCGGTDIRGTELIFQAHRAWQFEARWIFEMRICADCGLSELFYPKDKLDWVKEELPGPGKG